MSKECCEWNHRVWSDGYNDSQDTREERTQIDGSPLDPSSAGPHGTSFRNRSSLRYDEARIAAEPAYAERYRHAEESFLGTVREHTGGYGVSIFVDQIGTEVTNATLKALARPGILATSGWKSGLKQKTNRAMAAMNWHTHVHTPYARLEDCRTGGRKRGENGMDAAGQRLDLRVGEYSMARGRL